MLSQKLASLGANVTVSARSPKDFARIESAGMRVADTRQLSGRLSDFDLIFNTVPAPIFGSAELSELAPPCIIIDLASMPGGIVPDAAPPSGCRILHALSLPGKVAPLSAAKAIRDTVLTILHEEAVL